MSTVTPKAPEQQVAASRSSRTWLIVLGVVLVVAVSAVGIWAIIEAGSDEPTPLGAESDVPTPIATQSGDLTPVEWTITLDDWGPGIHTIAMIVDVRPLIPEDLADFSGSLLWDETVVDICSIGPRDLPSSFRAAPSSFLVGDIFQTTEGCGTNPTAMQQAFDRFGLPEQACMAFTFGGEDHGYCAPLN